MASGTIPIDYGTVIWNESIDVLPDFNIPFTDGRVIVGKWSGTTTANAPSTGFQGFFIHQASSDNYAVQIAVNISDSNKIFIRNKFSGTWSTWKSFTAS